MSGAQLNCLRYYARKALEGDPYRSKPPEGWVTTAYSRYQPRHPDSGWEREDYDALIAARLLEEREWTWKDNLTRPTEAGYALLSQTREDTPNAP